MPKKNLGKVNIRRRNSGAIVGTPSPQSSIGFSPTEDELRTWETEHIHRKKPKTIKKKKSFKLPHKGKKR